MITTVLEKIKHISYSQISMFGKCQLSWYLRYVMGIEKPPTSAMQLGSAFHQALAYNFNWKHLTGNDLHSDEVIAKFNTSISGLEESETMNRHVESAQKLLALYLKEYAPNIHPVLSEHTIEKSVIGIDRKLVGIIDLVTEDGRIIDFKLAGKRMSETDNDTYTQLDCYTYLMEDFLQTELHIGLKNNKKPAFQIVSAKRSRDDILSFRKLMVDTTKAMDKLESREETPELCKTFCNSNICQYWDECQDYKAGRYG